MLVRSFLGHALARSVDHEVLETLPSCQWLTVVCAGRFDASDEFIIIPKIMFSVAVVEDLEEAVMGVDFHVIDSFW